MTSPAIEDYHVGIVCALNVELVAVRATLDEEYGRIDEKDSQDHNVYYAGRLQKHNVVIACLPAGVDGLTAAATVAKDMVRTFHHLRFGLLVGIGGGIPDLAQGSDIRLGDVVVSMPQGTYGGVVQYDKGKSRAGGTWEAKGMLNAPPVVLLTALQSLKADHELENSKMTTYLSQMLERRPRLRSLGYTFPGREKDVLYASTSDLDPITDAIAKNEHQPIVQRAERSSSEPHVHYGTIVSANRVIKDASVRDSLRHEFKALCVEMEAAGLMNQFPCLVTRGICDYADQHKNDDWHRYAAATAAAFAKELLEYVSAQRTSNEPPVRQLLENLSSRLQHQEECSKLQEAFNQRQETVYKNDRQRDCHRVFRTSDYEDHKNVISDPADGTCRWVLDHSKYRDWHNHRGSNVLWISADPGCGKSVLSKHLVDSHLRNADLIRNTVSNAPHTICYFFFKDNEIQNSLSVALCALLHQLFTQQPSLIHHALSVHDRDGDKLQRETNELWRILQNAASDPEALTITCVLDALDECSINDRKLLIKFLCNPSTISSRGRVKWLLTSRPYNDIQDGFDQIPSAFTFIRLRGEDENEQIRKEINLVVREQLNQLARRRRLSIERAEELTHQLLAIEHRTYLWLHLTLQEIEYTLQHSLRPDIETIPSLPVSVEDAYEKILARIVNKVEQQHARTILTIIVAARRPLSISEMALALDVATLEDRPRSLNDLRIDASYLKRNIRQWCGLFIFIDHNRLFLIHQTAKEFLLSRSRDYTVNLGGWKHCLHPVQVELIMAKICVLFLCLAEFDDKKFLRNLDTYLEEYRDLTVISESEEQTNSNVAGFFASCSEYWAEYVRDKEAQLDDTTCEGIRILYKTSTERFFYWTSVMSKSRVQYYEAIEMSGLQLAAMNGHIGMVKNLLAHSGDELEYTGLSDRTALIWAAEQGHSEVVQALLDKGADVNAQGVVYGITALQAASQNGHEQVVSRLLDMGTCMDARDIDGNTALWQASRQGHTQIVQLLLDKGVNVNSTGGRHGSALRAASEEGHEHLVRILVAKGANVDTRSGLDDSTALQVALLKGHQKVVQQLLATGADVNARGGNHGTALQIATYSDHSEGFQLVYLLLDHGADVNAPGGVHGTALQIATYSDHSEGFQLVYLLLDHGADVNAPGGVHGTALQIATYSDHSEGFQLVHSLLDHGADVNARGGNRGTALHTAAHGRGNIQLVQLLLRDAAAVCGTALQAAVNIEELKSVQLLLDNGADINARGGAYGPALQIALQKTSRQVVELLLERGADTNILDTGSRTALQIAIQKGDIHSMRLLIDNGADINAPDQSGKTALLSALSARNGAMIELLLQKGADVSRISEDHVSALHEVVVDAPRGRDETALHAASFKGFEHLVQLLLQHGADVNARDVFDETALHKAAAKGHEQVAQLLLNHGADVNARDRSDGAALHEAAAQGHEQVAQLLLDHGADVNARDRSDGTALHEAAARDHEQVAQLLLNHGADINALNRYYGTPLHKAAAKGHEQVAQLLLNHGADVNARDRSNGTPLHEAAAWGHEQVVQLLLNHGADINALAWYYGTPLHAAAGNGRYRVVNLLLDHGADVNVRDNASRTALQVAATLRQEQVIQLLSRRGRIS